jgi:hypothetical protein
MSAEIPKRTKVQIMKNFILLTLSLISIANISYGAEPDSGYVLTVIVASPTATHKRTYPIREIGKAIELKDPDLPKFIGCLMFASSPGLVHISCERFIGKTGRLDTNDFGTACACGGPNVPLGIGTLEFTHDKMPWTIQIGCNPISGSAN